MQTNDSLASLVSGMGTDRDKRATTFYAPSYISEVELFYAYKSAWLPKNIVNFPAEDATRNGRDWSATLDQIADLEAEENRLGFWPKLRTAITLARLWGGSVLYIGTGDADPSKPLDPLTIKKGGFKYLNVFSRREVADGPIDMDITSETFGKPLYYEFVGNDQARLLQIHPSRFAIFTGAPHPDPTLAVANRGWGDSVLEAVFDSIKNVDSSSSNIASLLFEANVDVFSIPGFMESLSDPEYEARIIRRQTLVAMAKGISKALLLDAEDKYERKTISFTGLPDVLQSFLQIVSGASGIPVTRLLGQSPAGMSATGESDMKNYHDRIQTMQNMEITPAIYRLTECLIGSALGGRPPEVSYQWSPLEQMSEAEQSEIAKCNAETAQIYIDTGIYMAEEMRKVVTNQLTESGFYPGIDQVVAETGDAYAQQLEADKEAEALAAQAAATPQQIAADAAPRSLYVRRDVVNKVEIIAWAEAQGFTDIVPDLHVTVMYSAAAVDWFAIGGGYSDEDGTYTIGEGGPRLVEEFDGGAIVLQFSSSRLSWRHWEMKEAGARPDRDEYAPHITLSKVKPVDDLRTLEPYRGKIVLGPEIFEEVKVNAPV